MADESQDHPMDVEQTSPANIANISPLASSTHTPVSSQDASPLSLDDGADINEDEASFWTNKLKAKIWDEYHHPKKIEGKWKAMCKYCKKYMLGDPRMGTSHLTKHHERCRGKKVKDIRQQVLIQCLLDWNMDHKLSTITMDNCATNDAALYLLLEKLPLELLLLGGKLLHMRCCAHVLNLVVKEGLKVIEDAIENVRDSVSYWAGTPKRVEKFEETARQLRLPFGKKLILDCKTRWNSTYLMLETALEYKDVFARLKIRDPKYQCFPSEDEWNITRQICGRLQLFYKATELFSGTKYPTANVCFPKICEIKLEMNKWSICGVNVIEKMSEMMFSKFNKYWSDVNGIMGVATVLDPRYKLVLLEFYFPMIYGNSGEYELEEILNLCRGLLKQYALKERVNETGDSSGSVNASGFNDPSLCDFDVYASQRKRKSTKSELDLYLDEDVLPRTPDFDVLTWWKSNKGKYPILSQIARDILVVPVSTVASESAFSTSGRLISPHRSRLHVDTVEALMCSQNWMLAENENSDDGAYATIFYDSDDEKN